MKLCLYLIVFSLVLISIYQVNGSPKRRGGSSSGGSRKSGSGYFGSRSSGGKSSKVKKLAKYAAVGAGVYGAYQLGKATAKFSHWGFGNRYGFSDWNRWRQDDGLLCRYTADCTWIDPTMICQDYEIDFDMNRGWFGGDYLAIVGECECTGWSSFNEWDFRCDTSIYYIIGVICLVILSMVCCGCCLGVFCWFKRR